MTELDRANFNYIKNCILDSNLPHNAKSIAVCRLDAIQATRTRCSSRDVNGFFVWVHQPEGHEFWKNIYDAARQDEPCF
jgi:hypothetical protein